MGVPPLLMPMYIVLPTVLENATMVFIINMFQLTG